jgi:hypothetical protein
MECDALCYELSLKLSKCLQASYSFITKEYMYNHNSTKHITVILEKQFL